MAKIKKVPIDGLTQWEMDVLTLETTEAMKKWKKSKQNVYDKKFAVRKRVGERGYTIEEAYELPIVDESVLFADRSGKKAAAVAATVKRAYNKKAHTAEPETKPATTINNTTPTFSFGIDANAPMFSGARSVENAVLLSDLDKYIAKGDSVWPVGRAITIPAGKANAIKGHLSTNHAEYKWSVKKIPNNDKQAWLYKAAHNRPV